MQHAIKSCSHNLVPIILRWQSAYKTRKEIDCIQYERKNGGRCDLAGCRWRVVAPGIESLMPKKGRRVLWFSLFISERRVFYLVVLIDARRV